MAHTYGLPVARWASRGCTEGRGERRHPTSSAKISANPTLVAAVESVPP
jgi:hypothetical protein